MTKQQTSNLLSQQWRDHIDQWMLRYPPEQKRSAVFEALRVAQEENDNHLTTELMDAVADYLEMPRIAVYEVATFYTMYNLKPVGKHVIEVCTNISCMLNGAEDIVAHLKQRLDIDLDEITADGQFTLKEVECLGACVDAPACQIGKKYHQGLTIEKMDQIVEGLKNDK